MAQWPNLQSLNELVLIHITHRLISHLLIDVVRGRVGEVREEGAELPPRVEQVLADPGRARTGVSPAPKFGRGVYRAEAHAVRRRPAVTDERDRVWVFPQVRATHLG